MFHLEKRLQQPDKLIERQIGLTDDCPECSSVQFFMIRYDELRERIISAKDNVASVLTLEIETRLT